MLVTCPNCQNSYVVDDGLYAAQGAICEQCGQPLVPAADQGWQAQGGGQGWQGGGWQPDAGGWQPDAGGWQQAQGGGQDWQGGGWQPDAGGWQQAQGGGQDWQGGGWQPDAGGDQWGQAGMPPVDGGWQPGAGIGQDAGGWQQQQWGAPVEPGIPQAGGVGPDVGAAPVAAGDVVTAGAGQVFVGPEMDDSARSEVTGRIDFREVQAMYGDNVNPVKSFISTIPPKFLIAGAGALGLMIILFIIIAVVITRPDKVEMVIAENGEIVEAGTEIERTFSDVVRDSIGLSPSFLPFEGRRADAGGVLAAGPDFGVAYNASNVAEFGDLRRGGAFVEKVNAAVEKDVSGAGSPVILLLDEMMGMEEAYRTMYSAALTSRRLLIGGPASGGVSVIEIKPCAWPDRGAYAFPGCSRAAYNIRVSASSVTMTSAREGEPVYVDGDGNGSDALEDRVIGDRVQFRNIAPAIQRMRTTNTGYVRFDVDSDVTFGIFLKVLLETYGSSDNPNTSEIYLGPIDFD